MSEFVLIVLTDLLFALLLWLAAPAALPRLLLLLLLASAALLLAQFLLRRRGERRREQAAARYLESPDEGTEAALLAACRAGERKTLQALFARLREQESARAAAEAEQAATRAYLETWAHEIKTPLALSALVLGNHRAELPEPVARRLAYAQEQIGAAVSQVLYFSRLRSADWRFGPIALQEFVPGCLEDFAAAAAELGTAVSCELPPLTVESDRKALRFLLSQLLRNAFQYAAPENGEVRLSAAAEEDGVRLTVRDNGAGAAPEDLPFLFDKGFTGGRSGQEQATGMGLFLAAAYAELLGLRLAVEPGSACGRGFAISVRFPKIS